MSDSENSSSAVSAASAFAAVDRAQSRGDLLAVGVADEAHRGPDQVHHAGLHGRSREGRLDHVVSRRLDPRRRPTVLADVAA